MIMKKITKKSLILIFTILLASCSLTPGMNMESDSNWLSQDFVYIDNKKEKKIYIKLIDQELVANMQAGKDPYRIGIGDKLSVTVWGLPEAFPMTTISPEQSLRTVNTDGTIFFPYAGSIKALGLTQVDLRKELTQQLSAYFNEPQLDVSIIKFESQKVYVLGEVTLPRKLSITETPLSLTDALGEVRGLNTNTSSADEVYVIRQPSIYNKQAQIFRANLSSPSSFLIAGEFFLLPQDIIYVNAKGTTRWNRVISQFFPFSSFLNSLDNLSDD
tara:strand:+ start:177 stop:995 length:819 start_codon:yes stop_codon:yes gene_type:complete